MKATSSPSSDSWPDSKRDAAPRLSRAELSVLTLILRGQSLVAIARLLELSPKTVSTYKARVMAKLNVGSNTELVVVGSLYFGVDAARVSSSDLAAYAGRASWVKPGGHR